MMLPWNYDQILKLSKNARGRNPPYLPRAHCLSSSCKAKAVSVSLLKCIPTEQPRLARRRAVAAPMPPVAPVINAT
jgi:hypothetical protein